MKTDRELLALAAKAAGVKYYGQCDDGTLLLEGMSPDNVDWNPLADDGDALRLAVACKIDVCHGDQYVETLFGKDRASVAVVAEYFRREEHRVESARRAIVRAAAEIGRRMP
jgi:hypothetical protein